MKAGIYLGQEHIELRELPTPEVGNNDVLVQNLYSSVCGTDVAVFFHGPNTGHKVTVGGEFGHETVSRVVKVGKNITGFAVGERVYPYPRNAKDDTMQSAIIPSMRWMPAFPTGWQASSSRLLWGAVPPAGGCFPAAQGSM